MRRFLTPTSIMILTLAISLSGASCSKTSPTNTNTAARTPVVRLITDGERLAKKKITFNYTVTSTCDTPPCPIEEKNQTVKIASDNTAPLPLDVKTDDITLTIDGYQPTAVKSGLRRPNGDWEVRLNKSTDPD